VQMMKLPFGRKFISEEVMAEIKAEDNMTGDAIRTVIVSEATSAGLLWRGERNVRGYNEHPFDVALGHERTLAMCGIEIKGDTDNFSRLPAQLSAYQFTFPSVYIAVHKKEIPDWVSKDIGILRIIGGKVFVEVQASYTSPLAISTEYEWDVIMRQNGLGVHYKRIRDNLKILNGVRNNIIFNRFFGELAEDGMKRYKKFYPLTMEEIRVVMGWDLLEHYKNLEKDVSSLEKRLKTIKAILAIGANTKQLMFDMTGGE